jgi:hypothetical protein
MMSDYEKYIQAQKEKDEAAENYVKQLEAENERMKALAENRAWQISKMADEIERLKCCGNCKLCIVNGDEVSCLGYCRRNWKYQYNNNLPDMWAGKE